MMRIKERIISILIVTTLLISCQGLFCHAVDVYTPGDANSDRTVDLMDVLLISRNCAGWNVSLNDFNADCNCDDVVNLKDVVLLKRYLAGGWNVVPGEAALTFDAGSNGGTFTGGNGFASDDDNKKIAPGNPLGTTDADGKAWPNNPRKTGCAFKGWYTQPIGGTKATAATLFNTKGDVTLYAQFGGYMETPEISI